MAERTEAILNSKLKFRTFIKYAGDAIYITDENFKITEVNDSACHLLGYSQEELLGMRIPEIVAEEETGKFRDQTRIVDDQTGSLHERKMKRKDGSLVEVEVNVRVLKGVGYIAIMRDTSARKKAEMALKESEEKYRYLFQNSPALIIIWDLQTLMVKEVNEAVIRKYGFSKEEWSSMSVFQYRSAKDHEKIKEFAKSMLAGNEPVAKMSWTHLKKNGEEMLMEISSHKIIYNNQPCILSLGNDVTERIRMEEKLRESQEQLALFIEHSPASLAMFDKEMRYIATSRRWLTDYNLGNQNIIGKSHYEVFPEIGEEWKAIHQRCLKGAVERKEEDSFTRQDGTTNWVRWEIRPWYKSNSGVGGIIMLTEVITDRKMAEIRLAQSEEKNRALVENISDAIVLMDEKFQILYSSPSAKKITGYSNKDRLKSNSEKIVYEPDRAMVDQILSQSIQKPGVPLSFYCRLVHKNGPLIWIEATILNMLDNESVKALVINYNDVTEQKKATELFKHQFENSPDIILIINRDLKIESINRSRPGGPTTEELKGMNSIEVLPEESREISEAAVRRCFATGQLQEIENAIKGDRWVRSRIVPIEIDGAIAHIMVIATDITERKVAEEKLKQSEEKNRALIENISDGIMLINEEFENIYQSPSVVRITGFTLQDAKEKKVYDFIHPDDMEKSISFFEAAYKTPGIPFQSQFRVLHKQGHHIWIEGTVLNLLNFKPAEFFAATEAEKKEVKVSF